MGRASLRRSRKAGTTSGVFDRLAKIAESVALSVRRIRDTAAPEQVADDVTPDGRRLPGTRALLREVSRLLRRQREYLDEWPEM
jgi:hypothetical protein